MISQSVDDKMLASCYYRSRDGDVGCCCCCSATAGGAAQMQVMRELHPGTGVLRVTIGSD